MLKPQDILVLLKLATGHPAWTFDSLAHELGLSSSAVHRSLLRAAEAGLYEPRHRDVNPYALDEFLSHGLKYVFPPEWRGEARGRATAWGAPPLSGELLASGKNPPVWPDPAGDRRGIALEPLYPTVPDAVRNDERLWELLALVDSIRIGDIRERELAIFRLRERLEGKWPDEP